MTELEQLLQEELEKEKQYSREIERELIASRRAYLNSLEKIERAYIAKLEELCQSEEEQEPTESDIMEQLNILWHELKRLEEQVNSNKREEELESLLKALEQGLMKKLQERSETITSNQVILDNKLKALHERLKKL